ncbi:hypothetical protein [Luteolibacter sp. LG18]|uniref:hypothetical protein n=1 Tax=Luteolibacter sp. LG18 TaxID=2819286 RepID=UPI002B2FB90A|nr:hypothetical protein llg_26550 [Luteolibacter sp. LG18]
MTDQHPQNQGGAPEAHPSRRAFLKKGSFATVLVSSPGILGGLISAAGAGVGLAITTGGGTTTPKDYRIKCTAPASKDGTDAGTEYIIQAYDGSGNKVGTQVAVKALVPHSSIQNGDKPVGTFTGSARLQITQYDSTGAVDTGATQGPRQGNPATFSAALTPNYHSPNIQVTVPGSQPTVTTISNLLIGGVNWEVKMYTTFDTPTGNGTASVTTKVHSKVYIYPPSGVVAKVNGTTVSGTTPFFSEKDVDITVESEEMTGTTIPDTTTGPETTEPETTVAP